MVVTSVGALLIEQGGTWKALGARARQREAGRRQGEGKGRLGEAGRSTACEGAREAAEGEERDPQADGGEAGGAR